MYSMIPHGGDCTVVVVGVASLVVLLGESEAFLVRLGLRKLDARLVMMTVVLVACSPRFGGFCLILWRHCLLLTLVIVRGLHVDFKVSCVGLFVSSLSFFFLLFRHHYLASSLSAVALVLM